MTLIKHELRLQKMMTLIWSVSIIALLAICIFMYPEMQGEMEEVGDIFASMGSFTAAFGMDRLSFGTLEGFYAIECGNILGIGGAFFAAMISINVLSKEEKDRTADFLFTHPLSRQQVMVSKLIAIFINLIILNALCLLASYVSIKMIDAEIFDAFYQMHLVYFILQIHIALLCFGLSAFFRQNVIGIGLGLTLLMYTLNIIANLSDKVDWLKYMTPFAYTEAADIVSTGKIDMTYISIWSVASIAMLMIGYYYYQKKDLHA